MISRIMTHALSKANSIRALPALMSHIHDASKLPLLKVLIGFGNSSTWRQNKFRATADYLSDLTRISRLEAFAGANMARIAATKISQPHMVDVLPIDSLEAARRLTAKNGLPYVVLNMANPDYPLGGVYHGDGAQEEDLAVRSTLLLSLLEKGVYFDKATVSFRYTEDMGRLIRGEIKMCEDELKDLSAARKEEVAEAYKVYLNNVPHICFQGGVLRLRYDDLEADTMGAAHHRYFTERGESYKTLKDQEVFPFVEMRSSAPTPTEVRAVNLKDKDSVASYKDLLRKKIGAQLDTIISNQPRVIKMLTDSATMDCEELKMLLKDKPAYVLCGEKIYHVDSDLKITALETSSFEELEKIFPGKDNTLEVRPAEDLRKITALTGHSQNRDVILGAWGCGAFNNDPTIVAEIYREEIERRAECFDHIVFAIIPTRLSESDNFEIFKSLLQGIPLGGDEPLDEMALNVAKFKSFKGTLPKHPGDDEGPVDTLGQLK